MYRKLKTMLALRLKLLVIVLIFPTKAYFIKDYDYEQAADTALYDCIVSTLVCEISTYYFFLLFNAISNLHTWFIKKFNRMHRNLANFE